MRWVDIFLKKKLARDTYYEPEKTNNPPIAIDPIHGHCIVAADLFMITNSTQHITNMFDFCKSFVNLKFFIIHWPSISNLGRTWRGTGSQALMTWLALIRAVIIFNPFIMEKLMFSLTILFRLLLIIKKIFVMVQQHWFIVHLRYFCLYTRYVKHKS